MKKIDFRTDVLPLKNELYRLALRITLSHVEAEDIVQETMLKVWNRREQWEQIESIEAFCLTICRNLALDKAKRADRSPVRRLQDDQDPRPPPALTPARPWKPLHQKSWPCSATRSR